LGDRFCGVPAIFVFCPAADSENYAQIRNIAGVKPLEVGAGACKNRDEEILPRSRRSFLGE
jgi:hypothetical protein